MIDSHAHLSSPELKGDVEALLLRAQEAGITEIVNIATDRASLEHALRLSERFPFVKIAAATTPHDVHLEGETLFPLMEEAALSGKLVAVGETGLDYYYWSETKELQKQFFRRYLHLAKRAHLPFIIHCRDAFSDLFEILDSEKVKEPGLLHCFTGTIEEAKEGLLRGLYISFSGIVTYKKSHELREVVKIVPFDRLLVETDSPYLAPESKRGKQNEPAYIVETVALLAALKGVTVEEMQAITAKNLRNLLR